MRKLLMLNASDHEIPFIRDIDFLESKEIIGHYGFVQYEELPLVFQSLEVSDLDSFFYSTYYSAKAAIYARYNKNLFSKEEELKKEYALHLVYMALTRPIDTLYIQLSTPESDFSKEIIEIAKNTNAEILSDREFIKR